MKEFIYTIKDELGIHARPAGLLVKEAQKYSSEINIGVKGKQASLKKLFSLMSLAVKKGDMITVTVSGEDENSALEAIKTFFEQHL